MPHILDVRFKLVSDKHLGLLLADIQLNQPFWAKLGPGRFVVVAEFTPEEFFRHIKRALLPGDELNVGLFSVSDENNLPLDIKNGLHSVLANYSMRPRPFPVEERKSTDRITGP